MKIFKTLLVIMMSVVTQVQGVWDLWGCTQTGSGTCIINTNNHQQGIGWYGAQRPVQHQIRQPDYLFINDPYHAAQNAWGMAEQQVGGCSWDDQSWISTFIPNRPVIFSVDPRPVAEPRNIHPPRQCQPRPALHDLNAWEGLPEILGSSATVSQGQKLSRCVTRVGGDLHTCWSTWSDSNGNRYWQDMNDPSYRFTQPVSALSTWPLQRQHILHENSLYQAW